MGMHPHAQAAPPAPPAPPLAMHASPAEPDAWHRVRAPGGYECWRFDAESLDGRTRLVAMFMEGCIFHPGYLRQYARYRRRPTRVRPPLPGDCPCACLSVYRDGRLAGQFMTQYPPGDFTASDSEPRVSLGPCTMKREGGDYHLALAGTPWSMTALGPRLHSERKLTARLRFSPSVGHPPLERRFPSRRMSGADHHWILAAPRCDVTGSIDLGTGQALELAGRGSHDHSFGTGPVGPGVNRWIQGRVLTEDAAWSFHLARPSDPDLPEELHLIRSDATGTAEVEARVQANWSRRSGWLLSYPDRLEFVDFLRLVNPRLIDSGPFHMRLLYDAQVEGRPATALCEIACPNRLRRPVVGRMVEMSFDRRLLGNG